MSIFASDAVLVESIRLGMQDLRQNPWLLDHLMADFIRNPYLKETYGQKQIDAFKTWFGNNNIDIQLGYASDHTKPPCVSVILGPQPERVEMKHMADISTETVTLYPQEIGKPIPYVVKPFTPTAYDPSTGDLDLPDDVVMAGSVAPGMIVVDPDSGNGYAIQAMTPTGVQLLPGLDITASQLGIVPKYQLYEARVGHIFQTGNFTLLCTAHGDPQNAIWLHDVVLFCVLRYKAGLLEALGFSESVMSSGSLEVNKDLSTPGGETCWDRAINITGQIEQTFIGAPERIIEAVAVKKKTCDSIGFIGGIKVISNTEPLTKDQEAEEIWYPGEDE